MTNLRTHEADLPLTAKRSWWTALMQTLATLDETPPERLAREVAAIDRRLRHLEAQAGRTPGSE